MTTSVQVTLPDHAERRRLRDEAGHLMTGVAARVSVSPAALDRWERDRDPGAAKHLAKYAELLELMASGSDLPDPPARKATSRPKTSAPRPKRSRLPDSERRGAARDAASVSVQQLAVAVRVRTEDVAATTTRRVLLSPRTPPCFAPTRCI